jgi:hypothetical protein
MGGRQLTLQFFLSLHLTSITEAPQANIAILGVPDPFWFLERVGRSSLSFALRSGGWPDLKLVTKLLL